MTIAADTRTFTGSASLLLPYLLLLAESHPTEQFIFFSVKQPTDIVPYPENVRQITVDAHPTNPVRFRFWYNYQLPSLLKKYNADLFIGDGYLSLRSRITQFIFFQNHQHLHSKKKLQSFFEKATAIFVNTAISKNELQEKYSVSSHKIDIILPFYDSTSGKADWKIKQATKAKYTEEKEYFFFSGNTGEHAVLINLLKAFSYFKKWQQSNMMLIIAPSNEAADGEFLKALETYKYRNEVKLVVTNDPEEKMTIIASAYAVVDTSVQPNYTSILNAMQCEVPVIIAKTAATQELFADSVLYATDQFEDIGRQLIMAFKDETRTAQLTTMAKKDLQRFEPLQTVQKLWQRIVRTTG